MDNISRESNNSYLPVAGVIAGGLALLLSIGAFVKVASTKTDLTASIASVSDKVDTTDSTARAAQASADKNNTNITALAGQMQTAFTNVGTELGTIHADIKVLQDAKTKPVASKKGDTGPVTAGHDEYVVKSGDTGTKIAKATGFTITQLEAVNPGVDWTKLKIGTKLKLPQK
jgi:LysM repeat protein